MPSSFIFISKYFYNTMSDRVIQFNPAPANTRGSTVRDKISPFFGFFAMPRREFNLELRFADEKFTSFFNKFDNICRDWYFLVSDML